MSFSADVKKELSQVVPSSRHCQIAEIAAILRLLGGSGGDESDGLLLRTENGTAARKLFTLLKRAYNINVAEMGDDRKEGPYEIRIPDADRRDAVLKAVGHPSLLNQECCKKAFLRGAFLASGSLSAPEKYYHFEIVCPDAETAEAVRRTMSGIGYDAKTVIRKKDHVVYLKEGGQIVEILGAMGACISFLNIENIRVMKEMRGSINRQVNCETANMNKTIISAVRQIEDITYIRDHGGFGDLSPALRQMAELRLGFPDMPLQELGEHLDPRIGKSGVNHRLRKLGRIAEEMRQKSGKS